MTLWRLGCCTLVMCLISGASSVMAQTAELEEKEEQAFQQATALVAPSVVKIETVGGLDRVSGQLTANGPTTGLIIGSDGWIMSSAFNFAAKPEQVLITLADGRKVAARQVATDRSRMLTLLKIEESGLPLTTPADRTKVQVGQWALALGRTLEGDLPSVSVGIVSALNRIYGKALQTDAKVSPVNYGGPLINVTGEVMGLLVPLSAQDKDDVVAGVEWYDSGIGFAIPMADVLKSFERLKNGEDLLPGLAGIAFKGKDELTGEPVVDRLRYGSPAQTSGLKVGDLVTQVDGQPVSRIAQFRQLVTPKYAGDMVHLTVKRGEQAIEADLKLVGELMPYEAPFLGILPERPGSERPAAAGVRIRYVFKDSPAAQAGLKAEMVIQKVNNQAVSNGTELADLISRLRPLDTVSLMVSEDESEPRTVQTKLASIPDSVPSELAPSFIPVAKDAIPAAADPAVDPAADPAADPDAVPAEDPAAEPAGEAPAAKQPTGLITDRLPDSDYQYWAYVPQDYNPAASYGLLVWVHPVGNTFESDVLKAWRPICEERGIILVAPKAPVPTGWSLNEMTFIKELTERFTSQYTIDSRRIALHSMGNIGNLAYLLAFKERALYRAVLTIETGLRVPPPENEPDFRLQLYVASLKDAPSMKPIQATVDALRKLKFPVVNQLLDLKPNTYPEPATVEEFGRWLDLLDRI